MNELGVDPELRRRAAAKVTSHELPSPEHHGGVARAGSGKNCCVCALEIQKYRNERTILEYEVEWNRAGRMEVLRFHSDCFRAWVSLAALVDGNGSVAKSPG